MSIVISYMKCHRYGMTVAAASLLSAVGAWFLAKRSRRYVVRNSVDMVKEIVNNLTKDQELKKDLKILASELLQDQTIQEDLGVMAKSVIISILNSDKIPLDKMNDESDTVEIYDIIMSYIDTLTTDLQQDQDTIDKVTSILSNAAKNTLASKSTLANGKKYLTDVAGSDVIKTSLGDLLWHSGLSAITPGFMKKCRCKSCQKKK